MAKGNGKWMVGTGITVFLVIAGVIASYVRTQAGVKAVDVRADAIVADADDLELDGCKPAQKNTFDVALVQKDIVVMREDIKEMRTEQKEGFKEILSRLPK